MHAYLTRLFQKWGGFYGVLDFSWTSRRLWTMELPWDGNRANASCLPFGDYELVPHNGRKYKDTYAIVDGVHVTHWQHEMAPRFACCAHPATRPTHLQGCVALSPSMLAGGTFALEETEAGLELFRALMRVPTERDITVQLHIQGD